MGLRVNAENVGRDMVWIVAWVGWWGVLEILVGRVTKTENEKLYLNLTMALLAMAVFLTIGHSYAEE
jgi:hypothetical protein